MAFWRALIDRLFGSATFPGADKGRWLTDAERKVILAHAAANDIPSLNDFDDLADDLFGLQVISAASLQAAYDQYRRPE